MRFAAAKHTRTTTASCMTGNAYCCMGGTLAVDAAGHCTTGRGKSEMLKTPIGMYPNNNPFFHLLFYF
jgi:hypothetical protein